VFWFFNEEILASNPAFRFFKLCLAKISAERRVHQYGYGVVIFAAPIKNQNYKSDDFFAAFPDNYRGLVLFASRQKEHVKLTAVLMSFASRYISMPKIFRE
jgi:hypothetical protein